MRGLSSQLAAEEAGARKTKAPGPLPGTGDADTLTHPDLDGVLGCEKLEGWLIRNEAGPSNWPLQISANHKLGKI